MLTNSHVTNLGGRGGAAAASVEDVGTDTKDGTSAPPAPPPHDHGSGATDLLGAEGAAAAKKKKMVQGQEGTVPELIGDDSTDNHADEGTSLLVVAGAGPGGTAGLVPGSGVADPNLHGDDEDEEFEDDDVYDDVDEESEEEANVEVDELRTQVAALKEAVRVKDEQLANNESENRVLYLMMHRYSRQVEDLQGQLAAAEAERDGLQQFYSSPGFREAMGYFRQVSEPGDRLVHIRHVLLVLPAPDGEEAGAPAPDGEEAGGAEDLQGRQDHPRPVLRVLRARDGVEADGEEARVVEELLDLLDRIRQAVQVLRAPDGEDANDEEADGEQEGAVDGDGEEADGEEAVDRGEED